MTKVLVTGGAGYLGSVLVPALLDRGFTVIVLDSFMYTQDSLAAVCYHPEFSVVRGDVRSIETVKQLAADADIIIPLAALVGRPCAIAIRWPPPPPTSAPSSTCSA
jgi:nucleoside-diphosphate-sugar epimerase